MAGLIGVAAGGLFGQTLRVCADPNNLPFSNQRGEGIENRLAELTASDLGMKLEYVWWAERGSLLQSTVAAGRCDVLMGIPSEMSGAAVTIPWFRSTYVFVAREGSEAPIRSLNDPRLNTLRIGVHVVGNDYAPPASALARRGLAANLKGYSLFGPAGESNPPARLIEAVARGDIDIAIVWGPFAGYFAKQENALLVITPVSPQTYAGIPFTYSISASVRSDNTVLRDAINAVFHRKCDAIHALLNQYRFPWEGSGCASSPQSSASLR